MAAHDSYGIFASTSCSLLPDQLILYHSVLKSEQIPGGESKKDNSLFPGTVTGK